MYMYTVLVLCTGETCIDLHVFIYYLISWDNEGADEIYIYISKELYL